MEETTYMEEDIQQEMFPEEVEDVEGFEVVEVSKSNEQNEQLKLAIAFLSGLVIGAAGAWWTESRKRKELLGQFKKAAVILKGSLDDKELIPTLDIDAIQQHINEKLLVKPHWWEVWKISAKEQLEWSEALANIINAFNEAMCRRIDSESTQGQKGQQGQKGHTVPDEQN